MKIFKYLFFLFALLFSSTIYSQVLENNIGSSYYSVSENNSDSLSMQYNTQSPSGSNVWLTDDNSGAVPTDIYYHQATGKLFIYGKRNVVVVDAASNTKVARIPVSDFSQYYPKIENTNYLNYNHLTYDADNQILYCVSENTNLYAIDVNDYSITKIDIPFGNYCGNLVYYNTFLKYDHRNKWLYLAYSSQVNSEIIVLDVDNNYTLKGRLTFEDDLLRGFEINTAQNFFYASLNDKFFRFQYDPSISVFDYTNVVKTQIGTSYSETNSAGNLLYINGGSLHKLFCFPTFSGENLEQNKKFFVLDINNQNAVTQVNQCPSTVTDACYDNTNQRVYFSYKNSAGNPDLRTINVNNYSTIGVDINTRTTGITGNDYTMDMKMFNNKLLLTKNSEVVIYNPSQNMALQLNSGSNNYFSRGVTNGSNAYVIGTWSTTMEQYSETAKTGSLDIGGIVFKACHNPAKSKIYFYNTHRQDHSKVYVFNKLTSQITVVEMPGSIADIEINPINNNALISSNSNSQYVMVIDGNSDQLLPQSQWIQFSHNHTSNLFVSSGNILYAVITNDNQQAGVEIRDLTNNNSLVSFISYTLSSSGTLKGCFTETGSGSSRSESNNVFVALAKNNVNSFGKVLKIIETPYSYSEVNTNMPNAFDIAYVQGNSYLYIAGGIDSKTITAITLKNWPTMNYFSLPGKIDDIEANNTDVYLYVLNYESTTSYAQKALSKLSGITLYTNSITNLYKNTHSMKFNSDNRCLYLFTPFIQGGCQYEGGGIYEIFDNKDGNSDITFYQNNNAYRDRYSLSNIPSNTDIIIDPDLQMIYYGGGGHSCINTHELTKFYKLPLQNSTWLSIPRHLRPANPAYTPTPTVFDQSNVTDGFDELHLKYNLITGNPGNYEHIIARADYIFQNQTPWAYYPAVNNGGDMDKIYSMRGYKLELSSPPSGTETPRYLTMHGSVEPDDSEIQLFCHEDNWIGYFLFETQNVFDALGDNEQYIYNIQHQYFTCYRYNYPVSQSCGTTKSTSDYPSGHWICDHTPEIKYGDMIIVNATRDINNFKWSNSYATTWDEQRPEPTYYSYEEKPDYSTMVIDLDTTQPNPVEIGAYIGDSCVGSTSVLETDSAVVMRTYLDGQPSDSVVFEEHYAARDMENRKIADYYVIDLYGRKIEKRAVKVGERKSIYHVSFLKSSIKTEQDTEQAFNVEVYPNPAQGSVTVEYSKDKSGETLITVYDITGKTGFIRTVKQPAGINKIKIDTRLFENGIYLLHLSTSNQTAVKRFVVDK